MTNRTVAKFSRIYIDGYDMSGYTRVLGSLGWEYDDTGEAALSDGIKNSLPGACTVSMGTLDAYLDNTATSGLHVIANGAGVERTVMIAIGMGAAPAVGDPVFCGQFLQTGYQKAEGGGTVGVNVPFGNWSNTADTNVYEQPWGKLLHANSAATAANSTDGAGVDNGAGTTKGGFLMYQVFAGDGNATISIDDSDDDGDADAYAALTGATSGELDMSSVQYGIVALGKTATVKRYLRWQLALNGASTVTFALAFVRGR